MKKNLVTIDMDGTLFMQNSVLYLNEQMNLSDKKLREYHAKYSDGKLSEVELNILQTPILRNVSLSRAYKVLISGPILKNIGLGVNLLRKSGNDVAMLTFNPFQGMFNEYFRIKCDVSMIVELEEDRIGKVKHIPNNKITFLREYCSRNGINLGDCIHIGDSQNDVPTFNEVGFSVALNSKDDNVATEASISMNTEDFLEVVEALI